MKTIKLSVLLCFITANLLGQTESNEMAYFAYTSNNKSLWKQLVSKEQASYNQSKTNENLYALLLAQHGLLNATMADQDEDLFDDHYKNAKENAEKLIEAKYQIGNAKAILSAIWGWEMGYSSYKGMFLGGKSSTNIEEATNIAPNEPLVWQVYGSSKFFTPSMFGGDTKEAQKAYEKAVKLYEEQNLTKSNWRYLDALAWLGKVYEENGEQDLAKSTYEKALAVEPDFGWVKYALLPSISK
ncbi:tetratricopeptide repeat protein [Fulvivirga lutea]|uniref:Tetratricopeptide repeat protein n=1 Tax=Fulvivirga lutea TaxID=2810512 RepID=A0A975A017_9BACT|nr:tetratricopeptide repeat protein [Fulvivirga lutea]QSE96909.1 tetratricopeptide repeat protein [Fulvivirga lutea]